MENQIKKMKTFNIQTKFPKIYQNHILFANKQCIISNLNGPCRIIFKKQQKILEGEFINNKSSYAVLYDIYGYWMEGPADGAKIDGKGEIYNLYGNLIYLGDIKNNLRDGNGTQYDANDEQHTLKGVWFEGMKHGKFTEMLQGSKLLIGTYQNDLKQGNFVYKINDLIYQAEFKDGQCLNNQQKSEVTTFRTQQKSIIRYGFILNEEQINNSKIKWKMLDTSVVSMWSNHLMQCLLKNQNKYDIFLFGTDLIEYFAGLYLDLQVYSHVWHKTKHLQQNFSLVSGFFKIIIWPVCYGNHFVLGVVRIKVQQQLPIFSYYYYDSLGGSGDKLKRVIKSYLIYELNNKYNNGRNKQQINKEICNMKSVKIRNPRQKDGVSCGVFISKFMHEICKEDKKNIQNSSEYDRIEQFRIKMIKDLENNLDPFGIVPKFEYKKYDSIGFEISRSTLFLNLLNIKFKLQKINIFHNQVRDKKMLKIRKFKY